MKLFIKLLKGFGYVWVFCAVLVILYGLINVWMDKGFSEVQAILSPFNFLNWIITAITLAPGVAALMWAEKLSEKASR